MPNYDVRISKRKEEIKRRPSIELCLTNQKPVFIISKNMNGPHILTLIETLEKQKIPYQIQQETQTLGFVLNQQFFLIVDNKYGDLLLGGDFSSKFMTIVGYPRIGKNNVCKYLGTPQQITAFYFDFKSKMAGKQDIFSNFKQDNIIVPQQKDSQVKKAIQIKSIAKYYSPNGKQNATQAHCLNKLLQKKVKLFILQDKNDLQYQQVAQSIEKRISGDCWQKAQSVMAIRKKTLFHKGEVKLLYLANKPQSENLIKNIFIGEIIIYDSKSEGITLNKLINEPKIFGIAAHQSQITKLLKQFGFSISADPSQLNNFKPNNSTKSPYVDIPNRRQSALFRTLQKKSVQDKRQKLQIKLVGRNEKEQDKISIFEKVEKSKIAVKQQQKGGQNQDMKWLQVDNNQSVSKFYSKSSFNQSLASNVSKSKKIKRLKKSKNKIPLDLDQDKKIEAYQKQLNSILKTKKSSKQLSEGKQKKKTIQFEKTVIPSQKINTACQQQAEQNSKVRKIKSIFNVQPQTFVNQESEIEPNENQSRQPYNNRQQTGSTLLKTHCLQRNGLVNAIFYRQFVGKFDNMINLLKAKPQLLYEKANQNLSINSFVYMSQYDRHVRRLKIKLRQNKINYQEYNFIVLLQEQEFPKFYQYCLQKNNIYNQEGNLFLSTLQSQNHPFSTTTTTQYNSKLNVYLFLQGQKQDYQQIIQLQNMKIYKKGLLKDDKDMNLMNTVHWIKQEMNKHGFCFDELTHS